MDGRARFGISVCGCALALAAAARAQTTFGEVASLLGEDTTAGDNLGQSVALSGDVALVGRGAFFPAEEAAYFFRRQGSAWLQETKVVSTVPDACSFGDAVALDGNVGVVGDPTREVGGFCKGAGAASVYRHDEGGWLLEQELLGPPSVIAFATSLAIRDDRLLGGAPGELSPVFRDPKAVAWEFDGAAWQPAQVFEGGDTARGDRFGNAVALSSDGSLAVVGAPHASVNGLRQAGAAYVFRYVGGLWVEEQKLVPGDPEQDARFGSAVAVDGNLVAVSAPDDDTSEVDAGSVYVFRFDGASWEEVQNLGSPAPLFRARFGRSVALADAQLAVGTLLGNRVQVYNDVGDVLLFAQALVPTIGTPNDWFGHSLALDGGRAVVGAPFADAAGSDSGVAYVFDALRLALTASAESPVAGTRVTLTLSGGVPGTSSLLAVVPPGGGPGPLRPPRGVLRSFAGLFDVEGQSRVAFDAPPSLAGRTLELRGFGLTAPGLRSASNTLRLTFQ